MTIEKQTIVDQIEITRDGTIQIRFGLLLIENGVEIDMKYHRTVVPPNGDVQLQIAAVNADLRRRGGAEVDLAQVARVTAIAPVVQTAEVKAAYEKRLADQMAALPGRKFEAPIDVPPVETPPV